MDWHAHLAAWIVLDGNYGDFRCGDREELAFDFWFNVEPRRATGAPAAKHVDDATYDVVGRVVALDAEWWVLDIGEISVFQEGAPPPGLEVGATIAGRLSLGVDPFDYFEHLSQLPGMPPLIYVWTVRQIRRETAPFIAKGRMRVRDPSRLGWESVQATNARVDDEGCADYLLTFDRIDPTPRRTRASAG